MPYILFFLIILTPQIVLSHSGGLNSQGCHSGKKPYHCHRSSSEMVGNRLKCDLGSKSEECKSETSKSSNFKKHATNNSSSENSSISRKALICKSSELVYNPKGSLGFLDDNSFVEGIKFYDQRVAQRYTWYRENEKILSKVNNWDYSTFPKRIVINARYSKRTITIDRESLDYFSKNGSEYFSRCKVYLLEEFENKIREITEAFQNEYDSLKENNKI